MSGIDFGDSTPDWRETAKRVTRDHFNKLAQKNLHSHLVWLLLAGECPPELAAAESKRQSIFAAIDAANNPAAVRAVLQSHGLDLETTLLPA